MNTTLELSRVYIVYTRKHNTASNPARIIRPVNSPLYRLHRDPRVQTSFLLVEEFSTLDAFDTPYKRGEAIAADLYNTPSAAPLLRYNFLQDVIAWLPTACDMDVRGLFVQYEQEIPSCTPESLQDYLDKPLYPCPVRRFWPEQINWLEEYYLPPLPKDFDRYFLDVDYIFKKFLTEDCLEYFEDYSRSAGYAFYR